MLNRRKIISCAWVLVLSALLEDAGDAQRVPQAAAKTVSRNSLVVTEVKPTLEPRAIDLFKAASGRLAAAHSMSFTAEVTYESASRSGHTARLHDEVRRVMQRPDKLRVITCAMVPRRSFTTTARR